MNVTLTSGAALRSTRSSARSWARSTTLARSCTSRCACSVTGACPIRQRREVASAAQATLTFGFWIPQNPSPKFLHPKTLKVTTCVPISLPPRHLASIATLHMSFRPQSATCPSPSPRNQSPCIHSVHHRCHLIPMGPSLIRSYALKHNTLKAKSSGTLPPDGFRLWARPKSLKPGSSAFLQPDTDGAVRFGCRATAPATRRPA